MTATDPEQGFRHRPVMLDEVLAALAGGPAGVILDATLGGGGHAAALLDARPDCTLLGIDRDEAALEAGSRRLAPYGDRVELHQAPFAELAAVLDRARVDRLAGFLFDLGVSSPQLDHADRGFSYRTSGPLDMRMDRRQPLTAADVVNGYAEGALAAVLERYGDERFARRIAAAVVRRRPVGDTAELADIVREAIPAPARRQGGHPAKRTFQALRIEVNGELDQIASTLGVAIDRLAGGGRGAVLSYHSGEDRLVKTAFTLAATGGCTCPARLPCACGAVPTVRLPRRGSKGPTPQEAEANPRAASARLRTIERLDPGEGPGR